MPTLMNPIDVATRNPAAGDIHIHAIQTGIVRIRANQVRGTEHLRLLRTYTGVTWSDWLPIFAWVIEHPEGAIVVDTGETSRVADKGYFPIWHPYYHHGVQEQIAPECEIGPQLVNRWLDPLQVRQVVLTHLHTDHAGGIHHFPNSEILLDRQEFAAASGLAGRLRGYLPNRLPIWFKPTFIEFAPIPFGPFERSMPLTGAGDVVIVPTPGHTAGHVSVVVRADGVNYFLAGDTSYTEALMREGAVDGVAPNAAEARATLRQIRQLAASGPLVYLPAHDPEAADRLHAKQTV